MFDVDKFDAYYPMLPPECLDHVRAHIEGSRDLGSFRTLTETCVYRLIREMKSTKIQTSNVVNDELRTFGFDGGKLPGINEVSDETAVVTFAAVKGTGGTEGG